VGAAFRLDTEAGVKPVFPQKAGHPTGGWDIPQEGGTSYRR